MGEPPPLALTLAYVSLLVAIIGIDLKRQLVLDVVVVPGMAVALVGSFFWPNVGIGSSLLGGAIGAGLVALPYLVARGGMGFGDVKLAGFLGLMLGFPMVLPSLLLGAALCGLVAFLLLFLRINSRKDTIPLGPFLAGAALVALPWGQSIYDVFDRSPIAKIISF